MPPQNRHRRRRRQRQRGPCVRGESITVRGISAAGKAEALLQHWASMRYDAVLIQECKADFFSAATVAGLLRGWRIY